MNVLILYTRNTKLHKMQIKEQRKLISLLESKIIHKDITIDSLKDEIESLKIEKEMNKDAINVCRKMIFLASFVIILLGLGYNLK